MIEFRSIVIVFYDDCIICWLLEVWDHNVCRVNRYEKTASQIFYIL